MYATLRTWSPHRSSNHTAECDASKARENRFSRRRVNRPFLRERQFRCASLGKRPRRNKLTKL